MASSNTEITNLTPDDVVHVPQWHLLQTTMTTADQNFSTSGIEATRSTFVVTMELQRKSFFVMRLIALPMMIIVILSWSVFWMDKASLGDRISISFIGILTVVAYQMVIGEILPRISYVTLMNAFLNLSFLLMCATVVINLWVSYLDRQGKAAEGDLLDRHCRWIFPLTYMCLILLCVIVSYSLPSPK
ncbi:MAG: hypothetical protein GQ553_01190 [Nitrosomonadaceae bacterium]|nr:hypothetical protein [Nitrosomonadaceae bacterium]